MEYVRLGIAKGEERDGAGRIRSALISTIGLEGA